MNRIQLKKQSTHLPVSKIQVVADNKLLPPRHSQLFPDNIRALICGPSGSGKTNLVFSLLTHPNGLFFENIYILSKSLEQEKYQLLKTIFQKVKGLKAKFLATADELPLPEQCPRNSIVLIDDVLCLKSDKDKIRAFFCFGRHRNIDVIYLYQTYTHIDKHLLRENCNFIILFAQDTLNLKHVYEDHLMGDCSFDDFKEICQLCWREKFGFLTIVKENDINNGKLRKGLDTFISLSPMNRGKNEFKSKNVK